MSFDLCVDIQVLALKVSRKVSNTEFSGELLSVYDTVPGCTDGSPQKH